jgi:hypothetical protein
MQSTPFIVIPKSIAHSLGSSPNHPRNGLTPLREKVLQAGYSIRKIADEADVKVQDVSHFLRDEKNRVGKASWNKIKQWMIVKEFLNKPTSGIKHECPECHAIHFKKLKP